MEPVAFVLNADYPQRTTFLQFPGKTACFSGHREDALPLGETVVGYAATDLLKTLLAGCIEQAVQDGYRYFLDGLAEGVDLWAADDLIYRKQHGTEVLHLIAVDRASTIWNPAAVVGSQCCTMWNIARQL